MRQIGPHTFPADVVLLGSAGEDGERRVHTQHRVRVEELCVCLYRMRVLSLSLSFILSFVRSFQFLLRAWLCVRACVRAWYI